MDGRGEAEKDRRLGQWDEQEAKRVLGELAESGESIARFARRCGVSAQRIYYWKKRIAHAATPAFVAVPLTATSTAQIEITVEGVSVRVREGLDPARLAAIIEVLLRQGRRPC